MQHRSNKRPRHRTYEQVVKKTEIRRRRGGPHWFVGGRARKRDGSTVEAVYRADSEQHARQLAYQHFEENYRIFSMPTSGMSEANRHYRTLMAEEQGVLLGDTLRRKRHQGEDLEL